jgi:hypothetical protein
MIAEPLSRVRKSISPQPGDTWVHIAKRELSGLSEDEALGLLQSWNLHVFMRAFMRMGNAANPLLPSDIIFVEPPLAQG